MNVSLQWLGDHVDFADYSMEQLDDLLTFAGIEVEGVRRLPENLVVAQVLSSEKHPDADRLSVCRVDDGTGSPRQIVCGAKNYEVGDKVPLALPGCVLGEGSESFTIKEGKLRGVESHGMMCAAGEIGLTDDADGLMILDLDLDPGTPLAKVFPAVFELEITPNRPDCLSHLGVARELAALVGRDLKGALHHGVSTTPLRKARKAEIRIETEQCGYYTGRWIRGVTVQDSPPWLKEKLESIGLRPINNVVDITNYVLMEMGQPLHAFDLAKLEGGICVREAGEGETFLALDGVEYALEPGDTVISDKKGAVALGGVMGGEDSGVTGSTTDILLESAWFDPRAIRRTARRLGIHSDSSYRFERGVDAHQAAGASDLATRLILELAGGEADEELIVCGRPPKPPKPVKLGGKFCRAVMGADISDERIGEILGALGLEKKGSSWAIPTYRLDLERPIDLVEEVARVHGLEAVPSRTTTRFVPASKADASYDFQMELRRNLASAGFCETKNLKLISGEQLADDRAMMHRGMSPVRLKNPLNDEQDHLRPGLVPGLLACAERNVRFGNPDLRLFEIGRVFVATPKGEEIEHEHIALLMTGDRFPRSWADGDRGGLDIHDLRAVLDRLCGDGIRLVPVDDDRLTLACRIELGSGKKAARLGIAGIVPPARARELDIVTPVLVAEMNLTKLAAARESDPRYRELPRYPGSARDIAMVVPSGMAAGEISDFLSAYEEPLMADFALFDLFQDPSGEKLDADRKSLAWSITYRSPDRTLEAAEVEAAHAKLLDSLRRVLHVDFR